MVPVRVQDFNARSCVCWTLSVHTGHQGIEASRLIRPGIRHGKCENIVVPLDGGRSRAASAAHERLFPANRSATPQEIIRAAGMVVGEERGWVES